MPGGLSEQKQNELVQIFCGSKPVYPADVEALVSSKPGVEVGSKIFFPQNGKSPFLEAARAGKLASLRFMLERYPDAIDVNGRGRMERLVTAVNHPHTAVHHHMTALIASCFGTSESEEVKLEVVKYLISRGALVNIYCCYGSTPLMAAAETGHVKVLQYLIQCGADVTAVSVRGATTLHHAACAGSSEAVKFLIRMGAHVNYQDHYMASVPFTWQHCWAEEKLLMNSSLEEQLQSPLRVTIQISDMSHLPLYWQLQRVILSWSRTYKSTAHGSCVPMHI